MTRGFLVLVSLFLYDCSSAIDQSRGSGVHNAAHGVDSEGDEYEDDQEILEDSDASNDSDPELASPRFIRQTNLSMSCECFLLLLPSNTAV